MRDFSYYNPTRLIFGRGAETKAAEAFRPFAGEAGRVLLVYGGGSAVRSGLVARVTESFEAVGMTVVARGGVQPNPTIELVRELLEFVRHEKIDAVLAVGGGSVIDTAKAVAAGAVYDGDVWDFFCGKSVPQAALPVAAVLTIPAAGSEQSIRMVITNGTVKTGCGNEFVRPKVAAINPELFFTLPQKQISAGVFDMMSHIMERYFTNTTAVDFTSAQAEAALRVIMAEGPKLMADPKDYDAWSQIGLAGSFAHNGYFGLGFEEDWACHGIEHALSGWDPTITHGAGLAVVTPAWLSYVWSANPARVLQFARNVLGVETPEDTDPEQIVKLAVAKFTAFLMRMNLPTRLTELTDKPVPVKEIAAAATGKGTLGHFKPLTAGDVEKILMLAS